MNVVTHRALRDFWARHPQARAPLTQWYDVARHAQWTRPQDIRNDFNSADFVADNRVIFDLGGNKYRLVVRISYRFKQVLVKFVGTHEEYDAIDPAKV
jgi:mRNA interferase HigB